MGEGTAVFEYLLRWGHYLAGITWVGMLFYLNFIQGEYLQVALPEGRADYFKKLLPRVLMWFRHSATVTLVTGAIILASRTGYGGLDSLNFYLSIAVLLAVLMYLNVWMVIWPGWQISMGRKTGDTEVATLQSGLASRTNLMFAGPMLFFMGGSAHLPSPPLTQADPGAVLGVALVIAVLELNGLKGRFGPLTSAGGAIACSLTLTLLLTLITETL